MCTLPYEGVYILTTQQRQKGCELSCFKMRMSHPSLKRFFTLQHFQRNASSLWIGFCFSRPQCSSHLRGHDLSLNGAGNYVCSIAAKNGQQWDFFLDEHQRSSRAVEAPTV